MPDLSDAARGPLRPGKDSALIAAALIVVILAAAL